VWAAGAAGLWWRAESSRAYDDDMVWRLATQGQATTAQVVARTSYACETLIDGEAQTFYEPLAATFYEPLVAAPGDTLPVLSVRSYKNNMLRMPVAATPLLLIAPGGALRVPTREVVGAALLLAAALLGCAVVLAGLLGG
jgi:acetyl esterase/lipase